MHRLYQASITTDQFINMAQSQTQEQINSKLALLDNDNLMLLSRELRAKSRELTFVFSEFETARVRLGLSKAALNCLLVSYYDEIKTLKKPLLEDYNLSPSLWDAFCDYADLYANARNQHNLRIDNSEKMLMIVGEEINRRNFNAFKTNLEDTHTRLYAPMAGLK